MPANPKRKSDAARWANHTIYRRTMLVMAILGVGVFLILFIRLYHLQVNRRDELQAKAVDQQTRSAVVTASRGTIYDRNQHVLAISATAETVNISPKEIQDYVDKQIKDIEDATARAIREKKAYTPPEVRDQLYIARGLSRILGIDQAGIEAKMEKTYSMYETLAKKTEQSVSDEIRRFINGEIDEEGAEVPEGQRKRLLGVWLQPDSKRYYPYYELAANIVGFVNGENDGGIGLEAKYDNTLQGTAGMTVTAKSASGAELLYQYEQYYDAENGNDLVLTLDSKIQGALESGMESMLTRFDAKNGGTGIVMEVDTGAIVAMASVPTFDANSYGTLTDEKLIAKLTDTLAKLEEQKMTFETEESYAAAVASAESNAVQTSWRNKCIDSTYEPGSTFKPITLAVALEENIINMNSTFNCTGSIMVPGWSKPFNCSKKAGHGIQDLKTATGNSCNPAFISIGLSIGTEKYWDYLQSFGLMEPTGVDMIGEVQGIFGTEKNFKSNVVSLASYAFGQTFNVTPLELIRAQAACINGGYLYTPYIVEQVLDDDGNIVSQHDASPVRQVISEETSAKVRECLEYVVAEGTGKNGQVAGYRIGGKTGTADKTGTKTANNPKGDVVVSFMCFAPADDPKYIMLLTMDTPSRNTDVYVSGGNMVAPYASQIMGEILPDLGVEPDYTEEQLASADAAVPNTVGLSASDAIARLEDAGFSYKLVGTSDAVTDQLPAGGAIVPNNAQIILYCGGEASTEPCTVPDVVGLSAAKANQAITNAGLIMRMAGTTVSSSGNVYAISQETEPGTVLAPGEVVTVRFGDRSVLD
ncbi:MAG: PASTA domain-containing protein [Oscillibacter sp.]|nr:PASTA domain-containing protein [Oscillibacter sp.]MBQ2996000.1 PASTA domain-containing protein [Oscillibacter sp.]